MLGILLPEIFHSPGITFICANHHDETMLFHILRLCHAKLLIVHVHVFIGIGFPKGQLRILFACDFPVQKQMILKIMVDNKRASQPEGCVVEGCQALYIGG